MTESQEIKLNQSIQEIIQTKNINQARLIVDEIPNADIANVLDDLKIEAQLTFLRLIKTKDAAEIFSYLDEENQKSLAQSFSEDWGMKLLQELQSDELADVLEELPANVTSKILAYTNPKKRALLNRILSYDEDQVGSIMSIDISSIVNTYTCEQALHKIRRDYAKSKVELVHYYYVVDKTQKLMGYLTLEEIAFNDPETLIDDIYNPVAYVKANDKKEYASQIFGEHDMSVLPVTNNEKRLIGMITSDDVIDVIQEEATEDLYKMVGIDGNKASEYEYIKTPWYKLMQFRFVWLLILFFAATITQIIFHSALHVISQKLSEKYSIIADASVVIAFAALIPVLSKTISNSGVQGNLSVTRALALKEIEKKDYKKVILKETLVGLTLGFIFAILNIGRLGAYFAATSDLMSSRKNIYWAIIIASSIALLLSMTISKLFGALFPIIFVSLKKDPSSLSILVINTIIDYVTILLLFGFTYVLIGVF